MTLHRSVPYLMPSYSGRVNVRKGFFFSSNWSSKVLPHPLNVRDVVHLLGICKYIHFSVMEHSQNPKLVYELTEKKNFFLYLTSG